MALTNYNILVARGEETVTGTLHTITCDVTQGTVLDTLKSGAMVILIIHYIDPVTENEHFSFDYIYELKNTKSTGELLAKTTSGDIISLNQPDELVSYSYEDEGPE